jgi:hypothetical protein
LTRLAATVGKLMQDQEEKELINDRRRLGPCLVSVSTRSSTLQPKLA